MKTTASRKIPVCRELTANELRTVAGGDGGTLTGSGEEAESTRIPVRIKHNV